MAMNYLIAVFWDYPQFTDSKNLQKFLDQHRRNKEDSPEFAWMLTRFLEHARVVDTLAYFKLDEIVEFLPKVKLTPYTQKKWKRLIEVYGRSHRE